MISQILDSFLQSLKAQGSGAVEIHPLHLCRGVRPPTNKCPGYNIKPSDSESPTLDLWGMWSTSSLLLHPDPL